MKFFIFIMTMALSLSSFSASITIPKFELEVLLNSDEYELDFKLEMACRYEKFIIGDSAQYEYKTEIVPLVITEKKNDLSESVFTIKNRQKRKLELTGIFRNNKECQTYLQFFIKSKLFSIGWANQFHRPIRLGFFEHSRRSEFKTFDIQKWTDLISNKKLSFLFKPVGSQVNMSFALDDIKPPGMSSYLRQSVAQDPKTGMPFLLKI
jgi:hypothetical protein